MAHGSCGITRALKDMRCITLMDKKMAHGKYGMIRES